MKKHFVIKITGEAIMEKVMKDELEQVLLATRVEIYRIVEAINGEELSDEEERTA